MKNDVNDKKIQKLRERDLKYFEKGKEKVMRMSERTNLDPRLDALEKSEANAKVALGFMRRTVVVKKLSYLEEIVKRNPDFEFAPIIAMYIYFHKSESVSKVFYPNLYRIMNEFEDSVKKVKENDPYFEVFKIYELRRNKKSAHEFYMESRYYINKLLKEENISIKQLSDYTKTPYSNLYNFLVKELDGKLRIELVHKNLWLLWGLKEGWPIEKSIEEHLKRMKSLWLHWRVDIEDLQKDD